MAGLKQWEDAAAAAVERLCGDSRKPLILIAIDGKSGSGKSTLANRLQEQFGGMIFHMDDFFLRPEQRTKERLMETGGNVDYERFAQVLSQIGTGEAIRYQAYDCKSQILKPARYIPCERLNFIEGSYSQHPYFGDCYDLKIALDIGEKEQKQRILSRNGAAMWERFEKEWIPKENEYLEKFRIFEKSDLKLTSIL